MKAPTSIRLVVTRPMYDGPEAAPAYDVHEFAPKRTKFCVAIFAINENGRLHRQLESIQAVAAEADVMIADGGSTDGSLNRERLEALGVNTLLVKTGPGRLGAQMRMGFRFALKRGYEGVITIDGNNKDDPAAIPDFTRTLAAGYDHIQGSRFVPGGHHENTPLARLMAVRAIHAPLISHAAGVRYTDTTNGFRGYSSRFLNDPRVNPFRPVFTGYELHYYLAIRAGQLGFRVTEVPVTRRYPARGPTPTKITPFRGNLNVLRALFKASRGHFDPPAPDENGH